VAQPQTGSALSLLHSGCIAARKVIERRA
jgi:hypothetical protein